jgi:hypothetical protein
MIKQHLNLIMKSFISIITLFAFIFIFSGCEAIQKATNSTGSAFSLTGQWELTSNNQENVALGVGSKVTVAPLVSEARVTTLAGSANCIRQNDVVWKTITANNTGGFTLNNLVNGCNGLNYQPATITVLDNTSIRLAGKNTAGLEMTETWKRIK